MILDPYKQCPTFHSEHFLLRLIKSEDAVDLLSCYTDPLAAPLFNSDNCTSDFIYHTLEEMQECIGFWVDSYENGYFIRFSIVDNTTQKAIGTIECFAKENTHETYGKTAVLRLDIPSSYENHSVLRELFQLTDDHFYECFSVDSIVTKAVPAAEQRIKALLEIGYSKLDPNPITTFADYYAKIRV
jgi:RimJ/RimL family protein N-acetyltransferase